MNTIELLPPESTNIPNQDEEDRSFHLVLVYDEEIAAAESRRIIGRLLAKCLRGLDIHRDELRYSEIAHPQLRDETVELAEQCDLFVFATVNGESLPAPVISWLDLWLQSRAKKETALVCLIGSADGTVPGHAVPQHLQRLAEDHDLSFF